jgi:hypothetical protein
MDPQQSARGLPFLIDIFLENPRCGPLVLNVVCGIVIRRGIRSGYPPLEALQELLRYDRV